MMFIGKQNYDWVKNEQTEIKFDSIQAQRKLLYRETKSAFLAGIICHTIFMFASDYKG